MELFLYRLASHHRVWNVDELSETITIRQVQKWLAFHKIEPIGLDWLRTAKATVLTLKALGANVTADALEMFMPGYDPRREMTEDEMIAELMKIPGAKFEPTPAAEE